MRRTTALALPLLICLTASLRVPPAALATAGGEAEGKPKPKSKDKAKEPESKWKADTFAGLALRGIGPAVTSGRVGDIAVHPKDYATWYVVAASGGVWKTTNAGTTWSPIFDSQGSYSIGCITLDPKNPLVVWVGTGENNSQRSVGYGDGIYRSLDGGKSWDNLGLKDSEHIAKILVDPRDSNVVYVAAQGPLWKSGGERGLYKTTDNGKTWKSVLRPSDDTGVTDVVLDPRNPDVLIAATYQRRRHVWTLIDGGPESAIHKSSDGGLTWKKLENGLPKEEMGRIGLALAPANPDVVYAIIESVNKAGGFYRSADQGANWDKMGDHVAGSPQYYQELVPDPKLVNRVYSMDTWLQVSEDGGKSFAKLGEKYKHVDNHALWIEPENTDHLLAGCDGGLYESFDRGSTWRFFANLPITQFYRVAVDNALPFFNVYGGTQDNATLGGPSRTASSHGIVNSDWFVTVMGDGFWAQVDPDDPNTVYSEYQHGGLTRFDRRTGEALDIQPQAEAGDPPLRWNWDSPLLISPHSRTRLYFAAQRLFLSDDRGDSWRPVSPDLTRQIDRNQLKVMGRVWGVDTVAKNASTSYYGNIVALAESPVKAGLLYVGTDDGLIQVSEDGGEIWRKSEHFPGVPELSYVSRLVASHHDAAVVYAAFDNHKMGDFKPYVLRSADRGLTWTSVAGDLPPRGTVYALAEDDQQAGLLFAGTEFGLYFTSDGGKRWLQLKGGMPVVQVRDLALQKRDGALVAATFGRGFYILDDYSALRAVSPEALEKEAVLFPVKPAAMLIPSTPLGLREKAFQGEAFYTAPNPPFGAVFTYYLKDELKSLRKKRQEAEKEKVKKGEDVSYPTWDELRAEDHEEDPAILLTVTDEDGNVVRRLTAPAKQGFQRIAWDLRLPPSTPTELKPGPGDNPFDDPPTGPLAVPGTYTVTLAKRVGGVETALGNPQAFAAAPLTSTAISAQERAALLAFQKKTGRLQRAVLGAAKVVDEARLRLDHLKKALHDTPRATPKLAADARALETRLKAIQVALSGDDTVGKRNEPTAPAIIDRVQQVVGGHWGTTSLATGTHRRNYEIAAAAFGDVLEKLRVLVSVDLVRLEEHAESAGAPWTPGRVPTWRPE